MNEARTTNPGLPLPPDPLQDRCGRPLPPATAELLLLVQVLLVYARHLRDTLQLQAQRGVSLIAQCFGSAPASFVLTHLASGILRAIALEHVLLAPADGEPAGGTPDPAAAKPRKRTPPVAQPQTQPPSGSRPPQPSHHRIPGLPTLRQLEAAIRRRPVESAIDDIRHDLGLSFSLCEARFGNALRDMVASYRDSFANAFQPCPRQASVTADAPGPRLSLALPPRKPDAIRYIVGCVIGARQPVRGFPFTASPVGAASHGAPPH